MDNNIVENKIKNEINSCIALDTSDLFTMNKSWRRGYIAGLRRANEILEIEKRLQNNFAEFKVLP